MSSALRYLLCACLLLLASADAHAADSDVSFDARVDFDAFRTFAIAAGHVTSDKPEIDNRLFRQRMERSIRAALLKKGLTEVADNPDLSVTYYFQDKDVSAVERSEPIRVPPSAVGPGFVMAATGPRPVLYTEGTLVIDLADASTALLWRGTWRDNEASGPKLSRNLSEDARKLLARYPPKTRKQ
jgi:hypothetical protein